MRLSNLFMPLGAGIWMLALFTVLIPSGWYVIPFNVKLVAYGILIVGLLLFLIMPKKIGTKL